jgi:hypothetical protein
MPGSNDRAGDSIARCGSDVRAVLARLVRSVVGSVLLTAGVTAAAIAAAGATGWWSGWRAATVVSLAAAFVSLVPLALGLCAGIQTAIAGFFAGAALRILLTLGGCMAAIWFWHTSVKATLLLAAPFYLAQLVAECVTLGRAFWRGSLRHPPAPATAS